MKVKDLIGKTVVDIYSLVNQEPYGMDFAEGFIKLDGDVIIDIPYSLMDELEAATLPDGAESIFGGPQFEKIYHVNSKGWSIAELTYGDKTGLKRVSYFLKNLFAYRPYKTELVENKVINIQGRKIVEILCFEVDDNDLFFELDNGYLFTLVRDAPNGTGMAGIRYFSSFEEISNTDQEEMICLSQQPD